MTYSHFRYFTVALLALTFTMTSCDDDTNVDSDIAGFLESNLADIDLGNIDVPMNYDLSGDLGPGSYSGQIRRLAQLAEIVDSSRNEPIYWDIAQAMELGGTMEGGFQSAEAQNTANSSSDLRSKIDELNFDNGNTSVADDFASLATNLVQSSQDNYTATASNGIAGMITTGTSRRHVDANGLEFIQILEKGLYGAIFYDQMVDDYLRPGQAGAENSAGNNQSAVSNYDSNGTDRQHRWDEAFGYFGANPNTYPNPNNTSNGDGQFIANYTFDFSDETESAFGISLAEGAMDAFITGRAILKAGEGFGPSDESINEEAYEAARQDVKLYVEAGIAAAGYHYLNAAINDITVEDRLHHISEALAFIYSLSFNSTGQISSSEVHNVLIALGWSNTDASLNGIYAINLWEVTDAQLQEAISRLDIGFPGFSTAGF